MQRSYVLLVVAAACGNASQRPIDALGDAPPGCGDGVKMGAEQCDMADLGSATCASALAPGWVGVLSCTSACRLNVAGCNPPATTWNVLTTPANWSTFDVTTLFPGAKGFIGAAFDGRYLYFVPNNSGVVDGVVARYDTQGGFGSSGSWATFDVATVSASAKGFQGAAFDGRYVYLVPYNNGATYDGTIARYDTQAAGGFGASDSWSTFDIATVNPEARGFVHAAFDGRYLYLVPHHNGAFDGIVARYDTQGAGLDVAASWSTFDVSTVSAGAKGFLGSAFDGRYLYLAPYFDGAMYDGLVTRYDTQAPDGFAAVASWSTFNAAAVNPDAVGFYTASFDGRYIYFVQYYDGVAVTPKYGGIVARYDTQAAFGTAASWSAFDVATVNAGARGFVGSEFDGRYLYLVPYANAAATYDGIVARYDTQGGGFGAGASWSTFDVSTVNPGAGGFEGAGFDGRYLYLVPNRNATAPDGIVTRFDAKSPSWLPTGWNASFN